MYQTFMILRSSKSYRIKWLPIAFVLMWNFKLKINTYRLGNFSIGYKSMFNNNGYTLLLHEYAGVLRGSKIFMLLKKNLIRGI